MIAKGASKAMSTDSARRGERNMKPVPEHIHLLPQPDQENISGKENELSERQWIEIAEEQCRVDAMFLLFHPIEPMPKSEASFLRTFGEVMSAFGVFCLKLYEAARIVEKALRRQAQRLRRK